MIKPHFWPQVGSLLLVGIFCLVASGELYGFPQASEQFTYQCTAVPYDRARSLEAVAVGDDGSSIKAKASTPSGKYYAVSLRLNKGVQYRVTFTHGDKVVQTDPIVYHARRAPSTLVTRQLNLTPPGSLNNTPEGKVLLQVRTADDAFAASASPKLNVTSSDGGSTTIDARNAPLGIGFAYVVPGHQYTVTYLIGGKTYERTDHIPANVTTPPIWTLDTRPNAPPPACSYQYGPWSGCVLGHKTRQVLAASPVGCAPDIEPMTDTVCTGASDPPTVTLCVSWSQPVWGDCVQNIQHGKMKGAPSGCGSRDTTRACGTEPAAGAGGIRRIGQVDHTDRDTCETLAALTWEYAPVMVANTAYTVYIRISESDLRKLQAETTGKLDLNKIDTGQKVEMGDELYISDNISIDLSCDRASAFTIDRQGSGDPKPYKGRMIEFRWTVTPKEEVENAEFVATPTMASCGDGKPEERPSRTSRVSVKVSISDKIDKIVDTGTSTLTKIGVLLAAIAGVVGYFKGWFGGLFKRKEKGGGEAAS